MEYHYEIKSVFSYLLKYFLICQIYSSKKKYIYIYIMVPITAVSLRWEDLKTSTSGGEFTLPGFSIYTVCPLTLFKIKLCYCHWWVDEEYLTTIESFHCKNRSFD